MKKEKTYDEAVSRLEEIVASLERGGKGLDETLQLYDCLLYTSPSPRDS